MLGALLRLPGHGAASPSGWSSRSRWAPSSPASSSRSREYSHAGRRRDRPLPRRLQQPLLHLDRHAARPRVRPGAPLARCWRSRPRGPGAQGGGDRGGGGAPRLRRRASSSSSRWRWRRSGSSRSCCCASGQRARPARPRRLPDLPRRLGADHAGDAGADRPGAALGGAGAASAGRPRRARAWRRTRPSGHVVVVGFGINGRNLARVLREAGIPLRRAGARRRRGAAGARRRASRSSTATPPGREILEHAGVERAERRGLRHLRPPRRAARRDASPASSTPASTSSCAPAWWPRSRPSTAPAPTR